MYHGRNANTTIPSVVGNKNPSLSKMARMTVGSLEGGDFVVYFEISNLVYAASEASMGDTREAGAVGHPGWLRHLGLDFYDHRARRPMSTLLCIHLMR